MIASVDSTIVADFWQAGAAVQRQLPFRLAEPYARFRRHIERTQAPNACASVSTCTIATEPETYWIGFAGVHRVAYTLLFAVLEGCALTTPWATFAAHITSPALQQRCKGDREGLGCFFQPISTCVNASGRWRPVRQLPLHAIINGNISSLLDRVAREDGLNSELLVMSSLMAWVMRPQPELTAAIHSYAAAAGLTQGAAISTLAMHIRHGDKAGLSAGALGSEAWRMSSGSFAAYARRLSASLGATRTIYMTDDLGVIDAFSQLGSISTRAEDGDGTAEGGGFFQLVPAPIRCTPLHRHGLFGVGFAGRHLIRMRRRSSRIQQRSTPTAAGAGAAANASASGAVEDCGAPEYVDDGIQLFAGVALLAQCVAFVGLQVLGQISPLAPLARCTHSQAHSSSSLCAGIQHGARSDRACSSGSLSTGGVRSPERRVPR